MNVESGKEPKDKTVYVRPMALSELPAAVQRQVAGLDHVYAVHNSVGERIAIVKDRRHAFMLARRHDLSPVNVH